MLTQRIAGYLGKIYRQSMVDTLLRPPQSYRSQDGIRAFDVLVVSQRGKRTLVDKWSLSFVYRCTRLDILRPKL